MFEQLSTNLTTPFMSIWSSFSNWLPGFIGALVVLIVGYLLGLLAYVIFSNIFEKIKLDKMILDHAGLSKSVGKFRVGETLAVIAKWYVFVLFLGPAATMLGAGTLTQFLNMLAMWIPNIIAAILIAILGIIVAEYVNERIRDTQAKGSAGVGQIAKTVILIVVIFSALEQIGFNIRFAQDTAMVIVAGIMLALALALGLSFGLGGRDEAKKMLASAKKKL